MSKDKQWFKSNYGLNAKETPRDLAFCAHAILSDDILYVPNSKNDKRFHDNPLVVGPPHVNFYAGVPLKMKDRTSLSGLAPIGDTPVQFSTETALGI